MAFILVIMITSNVFASVIWGVSDNSNNIVCYPESTNYFNAIEITLHTFDSPVSPRHNAQVAEYGSKYIGVRNNGLCYGRTGTYTFKRELGYFNETISQAVIWFCADDSVSQIGLKYGGTTHWTFDIPPNRYGASDLNYMYEMHRVDLTDLFLDYDYSSICSLIIPVKNTGALRLGLNYFYTIEDNLSTSTYYYDMKYGWNHISMPFRINNTSLTLLDLFPGAVTAYYYNENINYWSSLSLTSPLEGSLGDICRSRSIAILNSIPNLETVFGYPIYEQHYMDYRPQALNVKFLFHGTVNCVVDYDCLLSEPDDITDNFIIQGFHAPTPGQNIFSTIDDIDIFSGSNRNEGYYSEVDTSDQCGHLAIWCDSPVLTYFSTTNNPSTCADSNILLFETPGYSPGTIPENPPPMPV